MQSIVKASLAALLLLSAPCRSAELGQRPRGPCEDRATFILVLVQERELWLCKDGQPQRRFAVALGRGGVGKREQGDKKTPLGTYRIEEPRPSQKYGTFIPIGYPTEAQRMQGYSGSAIGIHGPTRWFAWAGSLNTWFDWTQGCIAVGSDQMIEAIARWVRENKPARVRLE